MKCQIPNVTVNLGIRQMVSTVMTQSETEPENLVGNNTTRTDLTEVDSIVNSITTESTTNGSEKESYDCKVDSITKDSDNVTKLDIPILSDKVFPLHLMEDLTIKANSVTVAPIKATKNLKEGDSIVIHHREMNNGIVLANVLTKVSNNNMIVNMINMTEKDITLKQGTKLTSAQRALKKGKCKEIVEVGASSSNNVEVINQIRKDDLRPLTESDINCGNECMKEKVLELLNKYRQQCWIKNEPLGVFKHDPLELPTVDDTIINKMPYRVPNVHQAKLDKIIENMLNEGIISRSKSCYNSPLIIVPKGENDIRPCIDYRELNKILVPLVLSDPTNLRLNEFTWPKYCNK